MQILHIFEFSSASWAKFKNVQNLHQLNVTPWKKKPLEDFRLFSADFEAENQLKSKTHAKKYLLTNIRCQNQVENFWSIFCGLLRKISTLLLTLFSSKNLAMYFFGN